MKTNIITLLVSLLVFTQVASAFEVPVLSGGHKARTQSGFYRAVYTYVYGWWENGTCYYDSADEPGEIDDDIVYNLTEADIKWGSNTAAMNTLSNDPFNFTYCTQSCLSVPTLNFDASWPPME